MANYTAADVKKLREDTGAGMMDCKRALDETNGDYQQAKALVRERGLAKAEKKVDRKTNAGYIGTYIHNNFRVGAMVEMLCETDFVARNPEFQTVVKNIAMHITAMAPESVEELLQQESIMSPDETIEEMVKLLSGKIGEKFVVKRFTRYSVGE